MKQVDAFLDAAAYLRGMAKGSREGYRTDLLCLKRWLAAHGRRGWHEVTSDDLTAHLAELRAQGYADVTLLRRAAAFRSFFQWMAEESRIPSLPTETLIAGKRPQTLPSTVDEGLLNELIDAVDGQDLISLRDRAVLEMLYGCGLRASELCGLRLHDVDLTTCRVRVMGKGSRERVVPFGPPAKAAVLKYLAQREYWAMHYAGGKLAPDLLVPEAPLFLSVRGRALHRTSLATIIRDRIRAFVPVGKKVTPHTLRHAFATHLLKHGASLMDIRDLLGHASVDTTQIYTHVADTGLRATFNACFPRA